MDGKCSCGRYLTSGDVGQVCSVCKGNGRVKECPNCSKLTAERDEARHEVITKDARLIDEKNKLSIALKRVEEQSQTIARLRFALQKIMDNHNTCDGEEACENFKTAKQALEGEGK